MSRITITITITDGERQSVHVITDAPKPAVGRILTPADGLAVDLLRVCEKQASSVNYHVPTTVTISLQHSGRVIDEAYTAVKLGRSIDDACPYPYQSEEGVLFKKAYAEAYSNSVTGSKKDKK